LTAGGFAIGCIGADVSNYTILVIDYEPKSIERVRRPLSAVGYSVEVATDGLSGLETFHRIRPDLVMIEAMIPKKHGFEVCQEIKKTPYGKRTPVIITTSVYKGRKYRSQAFHLHGCDEYIEKPINEEQIVEVCKRMLGDTRPESPASGIFDSMAHPDPSMLETEGDRPVATSFSSPAPEMDEDELEIMARLDSILPGGGGAFRFAEPPAADHPPLASAVSDGVATETPFSRFDPMPLEEGTTSVPVAVEHASQQTVRVLADEDPPRGVEDEQAEADHVVSFEPGRSHKKSKKKAVTSGVGRGQASVALATPSAEVIEENPAPPSRAVARVEPATQPQPLETLKPVLARPEPAIVFEPEEPTRTGWLSIAVALALIAAAGALIYLYLGGLFGGGGVR